MKRCRSSRRPDGTGWELGGGKSMRIDGYMGVSENSGTPKSSILIGYKPSNLGYPYFWKHLYLEFCLEHVNRFPKVDMWYVVFSGIRILQVLACFRVRQTWQTCQVDGAPLVTFVKNDLLELVGKTLEAMRKEAFNPKSRRKGEVLVAGFKHRSWVKLIWYWELYLFSFWVLGMELSISGSILIILDWISAKALQYISLTPESAVVNGPDTDEPVRASHHFLATYTRTETLAWAMFSRCNYPLTMCDLFSWLNLWAKIHPPEGL